MDRFVARANIAHFQDLLTRETDPGKRRVIQALLDREREKLDIAERQTEKKSPKPEEPKA